MSAGVVELVTRGEGETIALGRRIAAVLRAGDVVAIEGELGAGKTRLVCGIAEGLGIARRQVSSPTFVLMQEYGTSGEVQHSRGIEALVHVDAYRLVSGVEGGLDELLGVDDALLKRSVVVVEWASRIAGMLGEVAVSVEMGVVGEEVRRVVVRGELATVIDPAS